MAQQPIANLSVHGGKKSLRRDPLGSCRVAQPSLPPFLLAQSMDYIRRAGESLECSLLVGVSSAILLLGR